MGAVDPALLRRIPSLRRRLLVLGLTAVAQAAVILAQAELIARSLADLTTTLLVPLAIVFAVRALLVWFRRVHADRIAAAVKSGLRESVLADAARGGDRRGGAVITLLTKGMDAIEPYFAGYLPELSLAVVVPIVVLVRLVVADWTSAIVVAATLPLLPVFGVLIGRHTREATEAQWGALRGLGAHLRDVIAGMPTLRAFGRDRFQAGVVSKLAEAHRAATVRALRIAFLSALALELVASVSVALVAVPVGLRLLNGNIALSTALLVLLLAPEAYLPLRAMGTKFHASAEGFAVVREALDRPRVPLAGERPAPKHPPSIVFDEVTVEYPGRPPALKDVSFEVRPGEKLAIVGPSGAGKSTVLHVLLGFVRPTAGRVLVDGVDLAELDASEWLRRVAWVPQRAHLFSATVAANIALGAPDATHGEVAAAGAAAALDGLPHGYDTVLGERGTGISAGQRQRLALARAYLKCARDRVSLVLLDEPTARLDNGTERVVVDAAGALARGRGALIVAHRPAMLDLADDVLRLNEGTLADRREVAA